MIQDSLRGVCVGAGYFSQFHYDAWSRIHGVEIVGLCDLDLDKAQDVAGRFAIPTVNTDIEQLLDDLQPDFIDIITRPDSHFEIVKLAAQRKVDVICQKPLAPTLPEATELVEVANEARIRLMVHENFRFQPWHREIKQLLESNVIGDQLQMISCRTRTGDGWQPDAYLNRQPYFVEMPRFLIYETGVHFVDTYRFLAGEIEGVYACLRKLNPNIAGEDAGIVMFEFANGAQGLWDASRYHESNAQDPRYTFGEFLIEGNGGSIRLNHNGSLMIQKHGEPEREHPYERNHNHFASDCVYFTQKHFIECLRSGDTFETDGADYLQNLKIQEAIYRSAALGLPVRGLSQESLDESD